MKILEFLIICITNFPFCFSILESKGIYIFVELFFMVYINLLPEGHKCLELFKKNSITSSIFESNSLFGDAITSKGSDIYDFNVEL